MYRKNNTSYAHTFVFFSALALIIVLPIISPDPYLAILYFIPDGILRTLQVTILSILFALLIGLFTALAKTSTIPFINHIAAVYIEVIRGIPLLVQLFYVYFALGQFLHLERISAAVIAMSLCYGAYFAEVFRAGIESISKQQSETAMSLGLTRFQTLYHIILPQTFRTILPPLGNECIALLKDSSLISVVAVSDILRRGREFAATNFLYFETYTIIALIYLLFTLLLSKGVSLLEKRFAKYKQ